ncbi:hypothetical protein [Clostridium sp. JNZ J1-5]|nr:hypothetical protein [Clostridium sp.]
MGRKNSPNYNMTEQEVTMIQKSEDARLSRRLYIQKDKKGPSKENEVR